MTPTEQDKELDLSHLKDVRAVLRWCYDHGLLKGEFPRSDSSDKAYLLEQGEERLMQLITADRKRVALKARLDEIKLTKDNSEESYLGEDWWADESIKDNSAHEVPLSYFENRIAELKAQQDEV